MFNHFLQTLSRGHIRRMLEHVMENTVTKRLFSQIVSCLINAFGNGLKIPRRLVTVFKNGYSAHFRSMTCLIRMRLKKIFSSNMFFYHFFQLCPRGHISKMLDLTVIKILKAP